MKIIFITIMMFATVSLVHAQNFQEFLDRVSSAPYSLKFTIVDSFMNAVDSFPTLKAIFESILIGLFG